MCETATEQETATTAEAETERQNRRWWTVAIFAFIALEGAGLQMRGAVIPALRETFSVAEWQLGLVAPAGTIGFLLIVVLIGAVAGRLDTQRLLLLGVAGTGFGLLVMGVAPSFPFFLAALLGRGLFIGIGRGSDRPLLSHLYPQQRGRLFGYYDMMWAVGATLGPVLVAAAIAVGNWRLAYFVLGAAFVPVVALIWRLPTPNVGSGDDPLDMTEFRRIVRRPEVLAMAGGVFLAAGIEGGLFTWLTTFATGRLPDALATASLSLLLAGYIPGRFLAARLSERIGYVGLSVTLTILMIPAIGFTFFFADGLWLLVGFFGIGLTLSGFYPTLTAYGTEAIPEHSAPVNATALVTASAGIAIVPATMGFVIGDSGVEFAMQLLVVPLGVLLLLVLATWVVTGPSRA